MPMRSDDERSLIDRRRFLALATTGVAAALAGCDSYGSRRLEPALAVAQRANERVERRLFRHRSEDRIPGGARLTGDAFPQYFVSDSVPVWDEAVRGVWRLEVAGAVRRPLALSLEDLMKLPHVAQSVDHFCVEGSASASSRASRVPRATGSLSTSSPSTPTITRAGTWRARCIRRRSSHTR